MPPAASRKIELEALVAGRFDVSLGIRETIDQERLLVDIPELDRLTGGLPRGSVTEVFGAASSGRTAFSLRAVAGAAARGEICAWVDTCDNLDPASAAAAGVDLDHLLWVRAGGDAERALQSADLLAQAGGFGMIVLDLAEVAPRIARRIPLVAWFRLRRAIENTPAILLVLSREPQVRQCAAALIEMRPRGAAWSGAAGVSDLLREARLSASSRKPTRSTEALWRACAAEFSPDYPALSAPRPAGRPS
jgi:hypothetical protein